MSDSPSSSRNPFSRRTSFSSQSILLYKITTTLSYLLFLITAIYYNFRAPHDGDTKHHHNVHNARFWQHNFSTPFAQSAIITSIYWIVVFILQLGYVAAFYSSNETYVTAAANLASHFVSSNLLLFGFVHLWVRSHFVLSLLLLLINFANLSTAYFRHSTTPRFIHIGVLTGPLAWTFVGLYWAGSVAVFQSHANHAVARIVANVFIWGWVGYAGIFLVGFKDYTVGYALSVLAFSTGVGQFLTKPHLFQLQWVFAFTIGGLLFVVATAVGLPGLLGREPFPRGQIVSEDRERAPLLADD